MKSSGGTTCGIRVLSLRLYTGFSCRLDRLSDCSVTTGKSDDEAHVGSNNDKLDRLERRLVPG